MLNMKYATALVASALIYATIQILTIFRPSFLISTWTIPFALPASEKSFDDKALRSHDEVQIKLLKGGIVKDSWVDTNIVIIISDGQASL